MTNHNLDTLARYAMHPAFKTMRAPRARNLLAGRMESLMRDLLIEGDEKSDELTLAILAVDQMPGPVIAIEMHRSIREAIGDALCDCGIPAGFHTKGCAGIE